MQLVKAGGGIRRSAVRPEMLERLRDLGARLDYVFGRYERLVTDATQTSVVTADMTERLELLAGQLMFITKRLQELMLDERVLGKEDRSARLRAQA